MDAQDFRSLQEAYMEVYQLDESFADRIDKQVIKNKKHAKKRKPVNAPSFAERIDKEVEQRRTEKDRLEEETDLYDIILSHLLDEGYAETPEAAEVIMVNMSEDWRESIVEEVEQLDEISVGLANRAKRERRSRYNKSVNQSINSGSMYGSDWRTQETKVHRLNRSLQKRGINPIPTDG